MLSVVPLLSFGIALSQFSLIYGQDLTEVLRILNSNANKLDTVIKSATQLSSCLKCSGADIVYPNGWKLAFRGTAGVRKSIINAYRYGTGIPADVEIGCQQVGVNLPCANHYRNSLILDSWNGITEVALAVYKNNVRVRHVIFNATGSTNLNWMAKERVLTSSWTDLKTQKFNFFSILGDQDRVQRYFFINSYYNDCPNDYGWFVAIDNENGPCTWEKNAAFPALKYAVADTMQNWNGANVAYADYFAVLVRGSVLP